MQYIMFVDETGDGNPTMHAGPVDESDAAYLRSAAAFLKPLTDEQYVAGPACVLHTAAKSSYVLDGPDIYWCVEWDPGLLIIKMSPDQEMQWVALRSPVPDFGGRQPLPEDGDPDEYDEDDNPQYNLIFQPWDAQFDEDDRESGGFVPADDDVRARFEKATARATALGGKVETRAADSVNWVDQCTKHIDESWGEGIRLKPSS